MRTRCFALPVAVFLAMLVQPSRGDVIISNFTSGFLSDENTVLGPGFTSTAMGFTMTQTLPLQSAEVQLRALGGSSFAEATLSLYNDAGGNPGSVLFNFDANPMTISGSLPQNLSFMPRSPFTLQSGLNYWLVLDRVAVAPTWTNKVAGDPGPIIPLGPAATHLGVKDLVSGDWIDASPGEYRMYQLTSSIPEPSPMTLIAVVFLLALSVYLIDLISYYYIYNYQYYYILNKLKTTISRMAHPVFQGDGCVGLPMALQSSPGRS
jgi:hypothetical protein